MNRKSFDQCEITVNRHIYYIHYITWIDGLFENEIAQHSDFSEKYSYRYSKEVKWFTQSNVFTYWTDYNQVSKNKIEVLSICTVFENLSHDPAAIWAHGHPTFT